MEAEQFDWLRFWIHFIFGAFIGALVGFVLVFAWFDVSAAASLFLFGVCTFVIALLGGLYGDRFWDAFLGSRLLRFFARWGWP